MEGIKEDCNSTSTCVGGACVLSCTTHQTFNCTNGDVYWWNRCGQMEGIKEDCNSTSTCVGGACVNIPVGTCGGVTCKSGEYCFNNQVCLLTVSGNTYFVAPTGTDSNPGTFTQPFALQKSFEVMKPGDIIYVRGGIYSPQEWYGYYIGEEVGHSSGTAQNPIRVFNYPSETPIIDGTHQKSGSGLKRGIVLQGIHYFHIKGFEVRNILQSYENELAPGVQIMSCSNVTIENFISHHNQGFGFEGAEGNDDVYFINCDSYYNRDPLSAWPYNGADGFQLSNREERGTYYLQGCRAWNNSDDGYDNYWNDGVVVYDNCWAMTNGFSENGDGYGFKLGMTTIDPMPGTPQRILRNCISAENVFHGFNGNHAVVSMLLYNNFAYNNYYGFGNYGDNGGSGEVYRNNLAYLNINSDTYLRDVEDVAYNSWNTPPGVTITNNDFVSLNTSQLFAPRKADGSLPDITFGHLAQGSDLINAGINVGLPYSGSAPDLGAFESNY
jgi:hypothetical protein